MVDLPRGAPESDPVVSSLRRAYKKGYRPAPSPYGLIDEDF